VVAALPTTGLTPALVVPVVAARAAVTPRQHTHRLLELRTQAAAAVAEMMEQRTALAVLGLRLLGINSSDKKHDLLM